MDEYIIHYTGEQLDEAIGKALDPDYQPESGSDKLITSGGIKQYVDIGLNEKYVKPSGGIPASDMASGVQTSLGKADSAYQKPSTGIPASDIAPGVIPDAVAANPTLAGTESDLTGLQVGNTKYKVPSGGGGTPYDSNPAMDGTASPGSSTAYARGDHVHPSDTSKSGKAITFSVVLSVSAWNNNVQTVSNGYFAASGYIYYVTYDQSIPDNRRAFLDADIYADNITVNGSMTFHCSKPPSYNITVKISRTEAQT